jgi:hypothetical protein
MNDAKKPSRDLYQEVTDKIVAAIEAGTAKAHPAEKGPLSGGRLGTGKHAVQHTESHDSPHHSEVLNMSGSLEDDPPDQPTRSP